MEHQGDVVLVTGGGSGIGAAAARRFADAGARVMIAGRTRDKLESTVAATEEAPGEVVAMEADIAEPPAMQRLYRAIDERWGRLDVVFAHAGINGVWAPIEKLSPEEWSRTLRINLGGTFHTVKYAVPLLKRQGGAIVITSSINGTTKFSDVGASAYCASKAGQIAFMKLMALELAQYDIRVNAICPGAIDTAIEEHTQRRDTEATEEVAEYPHGAIPLTGGDPGTSEQVADLVLFLASDRASHITGTPVWIDGGQSLIQG
jgi:NAD(P)-dependent dehydrogenase (short-subunit alcohol dehydrogenase family)